jgi:hypothetical protein
MPPPLRFMVVLPGAHDLSTSRFPWLLCVNVRPHTLSTYRASLRSPCRTQEFRSKIRALI